jgi:probable addiction module antidote protein
MIEPVYGYDPAQALEGPEAIAVFIADALETGDAAYIAEAMGVVSRAKGMAERAKEAGLASSLGPKL